MTIDRLQATAETRVRQLAKRLKCRLLRDHGTYRLFDDSRIDTKNTLFVETTDLRLVYKRLLEIGMDQAH